MKTITCDTCGKTVETYGNKQWSMMKRTDEGLHRFSFEVMFIREKDLDICEECTATMMEWLELEIATRPDQEEPQ